MACKVHTFSYGCGKPAYVCGNNNTNTEKLRQEWDTITVSEDFLLI